MSSWLVSSLHMCAGIVKGVDKPDALDSLECLRKLQYQPCL